MINKNEELEEQIVNMREDAFEKLSGDDIAENELQEVTLDDLGEVEDNPEVTAEQMKRMMSYFNGKINHMKKQTNKLTKRRNRNKVSKNSRKKNRKK